MTSLELMLLYLLAAVLGVVGCRLLKLSPMLGYLLVGVLIGPNALALAQNSESIRHLAEFGVVFLMFVIGLFFITIGMMLDWRIIWDRWAFVLFLFTVPVVFKFGLIAALTRLSGASEGISLRTGLYLAQAGEFRRCSRSGARNHRRLFDVSHSCACFGGCSNEARA